jgi:omega-amidase
MDQLRVCVVQYSPAWENPAKNRSYLEKLILGEGINNRIILLPEMFSTGFTMNTTLAETMSGKTVSWLKKMAVQTNSVVAGSLPILDNGMVYNRLVWCSAQGEIYVYDKRHLFRMGFEHDHYSEGIDTCLISYNGWNIRPLICYDLRFPVWSRNYNNAYDVLIYFANWPSSRSDAFLTLLKARAIENLCYVVGVNRIGVDGNNIDYQGDTVIIDPKGKCLLGPLPSEEITESIELSWIDLLTYREKFPAWKDADNFTLSFD